MLGTANKAAAYGKPRFNSIYYAPKVVRPGSAQTVAPEPAQFAKPTASRPIYLDEGRPGNFQKPNPVPIVRKAVPELQRKAPPVQTGPAVVNEESKQLRESFFLMEKILQEQAGEITQLRAEVQGLREELAGQDFGSIVVRFIEESEMIDTTGESEETIRVGTVLQLKSPFQENENGLWGVYQAISVNSEGMEIRGYTVLIARRTSLPDQQGPVKYQPLVEILDATSGSSEAV